MMKLMVTVGMIFQSQDSKRKWEVMEKHYDAKKRGEKSKKAAVPSLAITLNKQTSGKVFYFIFFKTWTDEQ